MRKTGFVFLLVALVVVPAAVAQQRHVFSVFLSDPTIVSSSGRTHWYGGFGAAFDTMLTSRVSAQLSIATEQHHSYPYVVEPNGSITPIEVRTLRTYPIDLAAGYHFLNETRWRPYLGLGAHYIGAPNSDPRFQYRNHLNPEVLGGVEFRIRRSFGITFEGKQLLGDREPYDPSFRGSVGLSWRF